MILFNELNKLLSKLPFNGKKTGIGIVLSIIAFFLPDFPINEVEVTKVLEAFGVIYAVLGVIHKYIEIKLSGWSFFK